MVAVAGSFHFADGTTASDSQELLRVLERKDPGLTQPHVPRGDYAAWIRHSLGDAQLASRVEKCTEVQQVIDVLRVEQVPKRRDSEKPVVETTSYTPPKPAAPSQPVKQPAEQSVSSSGEDVRAELASKEASARAADELVKRYERSHPSTDKPVAQSKPVSESKEEDSPSLMDVVGGSASREPIRDLHKPSSKRSEDSSTPTPLADAPPKPLPHQSLGERYSAREFLMGFIAGVMLTVIIYGILGALG